MDHPSEGKLMYTKLPIFYDNEELNEGKKPAPILGNDNVKTLKELGYKKSEINKLIKNGILFTRK